MPVIFLVDPLILLFVIQLKILWNPDFLTSEGNENWFEKINIV